jgi:hypothetical protein
VSRTLVIEIAGWGDVGEEVACTRIVQSGGVITATVSSTTPFTNEIGADVVFPGARVFRSRYTLLAIGSGELTLAPNDSDNYDETPRGAYSLRACVEDFYRLCVEPAAFVTGSAALARWLPVIAGVPNTLGVQLPSVGGVATVDSLTVPIVTATIDQLDGSDVTPMRALWRLSPSSLEDAGGAAVTLASAVTWQTQTFGFSPTYTAPGESVVVWHVDEEAVAVYLPSAAPLFGAQVRRGILGTQPDEHPRGSLLFTQLPTPIGARCRVLVYDDDATDRSDFRYSLRGVIDAPTYGEGSASLSLPIRTELVAVYRGAGSNRIAATARWSTTESGTVIIRQRTPSQEWRWIKVDAFAFRVQATNTVVDVPETGEVDRTYLLTLQRDESNPIVVPSENPDINLIDAMLGTSSLAITWDGGRARFAGDLLNIDAVVGLGEPTPCHVFETSAPAYTVTGSTEQPQQTASTGVALCSVSSALAQVLCSTGTGTNRGPLDVYAPWYSGSVDCLPQDVGLGVPQEGIDRVAALAVDALTVVRALMPDSQIGNLVLTVDDGEDLGKWLSEQLLQPFGLALVTTQAGNLRVVPTYPVDSTNSDIDCDTDLRGEPGDDVPAVSARWDTSRIVATYGAQIRVLPDARSVLPETPFGGESQFALAQWAALETRRYIIRGDVASNGRTTVATRIGSGGLTLEPGWVVLPGADAIASQVQAAGQRYMQANALPRLAVDLVIAASVVGDRELGDIVGLANCPIPGSTGTRGIDAFAQITGLQRVLASDRVLIRLLVQPRFSSAPRWTPVGLIVSSPTSETINIMDAWSGPGGGVLDAELFRVGDEVMLVDSAFALRSSDVRGITAINGSTITIDAGFTNGGDVIIAAGDMLILAPKDEQPGATQLARRGWLDYGGAGDPTRWIPDGIPSD